MPDDTGLGCSPSDGGALLTGAGVADVADVAVAAAEPAGVSVFGTCAGGLTPAGDATAGLVAAAVLDGTAGSFDSTGGASSTATTKRCVHAGPATRAVSGAAVLRNDP